ncbi:MAG TPA: DUF2851 family protein [Thermomicrobiales bacterium]|nr:DUF2851 family protein [Thermomicrobiales bacterium]
MPGHELTELALSRIWQAGRVAREMRTSDGRRVHVIYPGVWTHADGPDFRDAMIELAGVMLRGSVELHLKAGDWRRHGHHSNPAYDDVILHAVLDNDLDETISQPPGRSIPTVELRNFLTIDLASMLNAPRDEPLGGLGRYACLPTLAGGRDDVVRAVLRREGWKRLAEKQLRYCQEFERLSPAAALYHGLLDGMGLTRNRDGMARVAERLPLSLIDRAVAERGPDAAQALLLGAGGFLPLGPFETQLIGLDATRAGRAVALFEQIAAAADIVPVSASVWELRRVRPMNHPARRLASLASLIALSTPTGILDRCLNGRAEDADPWREWLSSAAPGIGASRAMQLTANVLAPFMAAYASASGDVALADRAAAVWERLPGRADDAIARGALEQIVGKQRFPVRLAIEAQGLHQIGRHGCRNLRCFECPIAELSMTHERPGV